MTLDFSIANATSRSLLAFGSTVQIWNVHYYLHPATVCCDQTGPDQSSVERLHESDDDDDDDDDYDETPTRDLSITLNRSGRADEISNFEENRRRREEKEPN